MLDPAQTRDDIVNGMDLSRRADLVEKMDRRDSPRDQLDRTLSHFQWVNRLFTRYRSLLTRGVLRDMARDPARPYRLADLGAGGCDIARWLIRRCRARGLHLTILAVEHDPRVARYARTANAGYPEIKVVEGDASEAGLWAGADYLFANHLLHHLSNEACIELLRRMDRAGPRLYLLSDLIRSPWAYVGFRIAVAPFFRKSFIAGDGLASIRRGFTLPEVRALLQAAAPIHPATVERYAPSRFVIRGGRWSRAHAPGAEPRPTTRNRMHDGVSMVPVVGRPSVGGVVGRPSVGGVVGRPSVGGVVGRPSVGGVVGRPSVGGVVGRPSVGGVGVVGEPARHAPGAEPRPTTRNRMHGGVSMVPVVGRPSVVGARVGGGIVTMVRRHCDGR